MERPLADKRPLGPIFNFSSSTNIDQPYDVAFKKSRLDRTLCEEITTFARLKLEDALIKQTRESIETAFGMVVQDKKVYFTDTKGGVSNSIPIEVINNIDSELDEIEQAVGGGRRCLVHTHTRDATPSRPDVKTFLSSLSTNDDIFDRDRDNVPQFDCFSIVGALGDREAEIYTWEITSIPSESEFSRLVDEVTADGEYDKKDRNQFEEDVLETFNQYINTCRTRFKVKQPVDTQV